ncbi:MAG: hypothetical protein GC152_08780 [Alphaproteobacteria bacterium]|nr:hypothetical protein [Alphaproteobacteria bacterium]
MKRIALLASLAGALALAAGGASAGEHGDKAAKMEAKFAKLDADSNGSVSEAEYIAHKRAWHAEKGKEFTADAEAKAKEHFAKMSGGDGSFTLAEMKEAYSKDGKKSRG